MKNFRIIILFSIFLFFSLFIFQRIVVARSSYASLNNYAYMNPYQTNPSYEWYYIHQTDENQDQMDQIFVDYLSTYPINQLTLDEMMLTIDEIKGYVINDYEFADLSYGMMGSHHMYSSRNKLIYDYSYEWYYFHVSYNQKLIFDQMFAHGIMNIPMDQLTKDQIVDEIKDLKTEIIITYINE